MPTGSKEKLVSFFDSLESLEISYRRGSHYSYEWKNLGNRERYKRKKWHSLNHCVHVYSRRNSFATNYVCERSRVCWKIYDPSGTTMDIDKTVKQRMQVRLVDLRIINKEVTIDFLENEEIVRVFKRWKSSNKILHPLGRFWTIWKKFPLLYRPLPRFSRNYASDLDSWFTFKPCWNSSSP